MRCVAEAALVSAAATPPAPADSSSLLYLAGHKKVRGCRKLQNLTIPKNTGLSNVSLISYLTWPGPPPIPAGWSSETF
jgi:hypothetical protein